VKNGANWDLYQPGVPFLPFGMLRPQNEHSVAVVGNWQQAELTPTQTHDSGATKEFRKGVFELKTDGTLVGKATIRIGGFMAYEMKRDMKVKTTEQRIEHYKDTIRERIPAAELTDVTIANADDTEKDLEISYSVTVPGYADVTDSRLFFEVNYFEKGRGALFTKEKRVCPVRFTYGWETGDDITIQYPAGYSVEEGAAPHSLSNTKQFVYIAKLGLDKGKNEIFYKLDRKLNILDVPAQVYPGMKQYFDSVDRENHHVLTLLRTDEIGAEKSNAAGETAKKE
jgi:hypothetical protein